MQDGFHMFEKISSRSLQRLGLGVVKLSIPFFRLRYYVEAINMRLKLAIYTCAQPKVIIFIFLLYNNNEFIKNVISVIRAIK